MAREMTPQERAVSELNDKLAQAFVCPDTTLGKCRDIIASALTDTRRAALLEAAAVAEKCKNDSALGPVRDAYSYVEANLRRLAQEG